MFSPPPTPAILRFRRACALLLALFIPLPVQARQPDPPQRIPLEPFGFQTISSRYLLEGATMLTVDYVDNQHLLVSFGVSRLMSRLTDCPADDEDRIVKAVLLELPTGRELAHTEWRFHDLGQYLWNLGDGHFLLRNRDVLTTLSPLQNLASNQSFAEQPFLHFDRRIQAILVSANRDLLSIETVKRSPPKPVSVQTVSQPTPNQSTILSTGLQRRDPNETKPDPTPTQVDFIRLVKTAATPLSTRLVGRLDGRIFTSAAVNIPVTTEGFLRSKATTRDGVLLDFLTFTGKDLDLGDFATSCPPRPTFVSPSEFVAFGCRGDAGSLDLAGFNLRGDFLWQLNFTDEQAYPSFASAVPAGRFAFSRTVTSTHVFGNETPSLSQLQAQEVRVIQMYNGKQLLRVVTSPIQRAGQNFTLSPDGLSLAVIHDNPTAKGDVVTHQTSIEIYRLPALSGKDLDQIKLEAAMAPAPAEVHMRFSADEIKAALAAKPDTTESAPADAHATTPADSRIAGDAIPPASIATPAEASTSGTVPSSDPAPACANLANANPTPAACPVTPPSKSVAATTPAATATNGDAPSEKRRKPPTLYEPAPPQ
jgi:hypothetical protein